VVLFRTTAITRPDIPDLPPIRAASIPRSLPWNSHWRLFLMLLWAAGSLGALSQMLIAFVRMRNVRRAAELSPHCAAAAIIARELGIRQAVDVLGLGPGAMPMTFGILRPVVSCRATRPRGARSGDTSYCCMS
jgi:beta-lactamase regulating signal transducer with metallopeptidase domain